MSAPYFKYGFFNEDFSLIVAFVIGIGFGFFLERAGFGSARKLAAQFYLTDMRVFKVMFSAIVTAMLGIFWLSWAGVVDLSMVYLTPTFIVPQIVGGLILGVGFVVGGYCPGTSCVGVSSGKLDAAVYLLGIVAGIFVFGEMYPAIHTLVNATPMGQVTVPGYFGISYGLVVLAVSLMAFGGFAGATWVERWMARRKEA